MQNKEIGLTVNGMTCAHCASSVNKFFGEKRDEGYLC